VQSLLESQNLIAEVEQSGTYTSEDESDDESLKKMDYLDFFF